MANFEAFQSFTTSRLPASKASSANIVSVPSLLEHAQ